MKEIYFCVDMMAYRVILDALADQNKQPASSRFYEVTQRLINIGKEYIVTASLAHLSFELLGKGYQIFLCKGDKKVKIDSKMMGLGRSPTPLLMCFKAGWFDELLNSKE